MNQTVLCLRLSKSDFWRTYGPVNVLMVVVAMMLGPLALLILVFPGREGELLKRAAVAGTSLTFFSLGMVFCAGELRSLRAIFSNRPYLTFSEGGIGLDAGMFDRWFFPWQEIDAMAPHPEALAEALAMGGFFHVTLRTHRAFSHRRRLSQVQHPNFVNYYRFSGRMTLASEEQVHCFVRLCTTHIRFFEPMLSDE